VLCSEGKHFCAGADLRDATAQTIRRIYRYAFALFTGRSVSGAEAQQLGLCDRVVDDDVRGAALEVATAIAGSAPLSLASIRSTMRRRLVADVSAALDTEAAAQAALLGTADFKEGVRASIERRAPEFEGK
jgi:enoyl-CoA hydratase/carnithine racemase